MELTRVILSKLWSLPTLSWQDSLSRFKHIFNLNMAQRTSNIKVYHLSGNHDIGSAAVNSQKPDIIKRYEREFGGRNFKVTLGHPQSDLTSATLNFIRNVSKGINSTPSVLLTHIPLYRLDWSPCGPHRCSAVISQRMYRARHTQEISYQNYVTKNSTDDLMDLIRPALVLSGHDHDQCTVTHTSKNGPVSEHTLGTVSWQQGNLYPSFMLVSARNSTLNGTTPDDAVLTHLCFLPMQTHIYIWYLSLFAINLVIALLGPANEVLILHKLGALIGCLRNLFNFSSFVNSMKEKNGDDNCEYEEIWNAEGSIHLIKKTSKATTKPSDKRNSIERGNAVMRSSVTRKQSSPEIDVIHVESDVKLPTRSNRSKGRMIIWRLLPTFRVLVIVAAINVPLNNWMWCLLCS